MTISYYLLPFLVRRRTCIAVRIAVGYCTDVHVCVCVYGCVCVCVCVLVCVGALGRQVATWFKGGVLYPVTEWDTRIVSQQH